MREVKDIMLAVVIRVNSRDWSETDVVTVTSDTTSAASNAARRGQGFRGGFASKRSTGGRRSSIS